MSDKIIMYDSDEAAQYETVKGWVAADGRFYGENEDLARYAGCTHRPCKQCGEPTNKNWMFCYKCRREKELAKYNELPTEIWDGQSFVYSETLDEYFDDMDSFLDAMFDRDMRIKDAMLVHCKQVKPRDLDPDDIYQDDLPEDTGLPAEIYEAFEELNKLVAKHFPESWYPDKIAVDMESFKDVVEPLYGTP